MIGLYLKIPQNFVHLILRDGFLVMHIPRVHMIKFKFLTHFPVDRLLIQSCLLSYPCSANLLHSLIIYLLFYCVLSIFYLTLLLLMALFCVAICRDSVSRFRVPFRSHVQVFSYDYCYYCCCYYINNKTEMGRETIVWIPQRTIWLIVLEINRTCLRKGMSFGLVWFGLVSLFNGIINFCRLFNAILLEE